MNGPLLLLLACVGPKPADGGPADTEAHSLDSDSGSTHTAETDSAVDSGETGDSAPPLDWHAGDPIPGWDDTNCDDVPRTRRLRARFPDVLRVVGTFEAGGAGWGPHSWNVQVRDCDGFPCSDEDEEIRMSFPGVKATLSGGSDAAAEPRAQGWWGPDASERRAVTLAGNGPFVSWSNGGYGDIGVGTACFQTVRPDRVSGFLRIEIPARNSTPEIDVYTSYYLDVPFDVVVPERGAVDARAPATGTPPEGFTFVHFVYEQPFESAWAWDQIEDARVADVLKERYRPYNAP